MVKDAGDNLAAFLLVIPSVWECWLREVCFGCTYQPILDGNEILSMLTSLLLASATVRNVQLTIF